MLKRAIILSMADAMRLGALAEPISLQCLSQINSDVHFALSYVKDRKINEILRRYFRFYIVSMIDFYEYKEGDKILAVKIDDQYFKLFKMPPPPTKALITLHE